MPNDNKALGDKSEPTIDLDRLLGFKQLNIVSDTTENSTLKENADRFFNKIGEVPPPPDPP